MITRKQTQSGVKISFTSAWKSFRDSTDVKPSNRHHTPISWSHGHELVENMVTLGGIFYENPLDGCYVSFEEVTLDMTNKTSKVPQGAEIVSFSGKKMVVRVPVTVGRVFVTFPTAVGRSPGNLLGLVRSTDKADLKRLALAELAPDNEV